MNAAVQQVLDSFEALAEEDKHRVVVEILRRDSVIHDDVPETALIEAADQLFYTLDAEEDARAQR
jgi:hypothetical protein